MVLDRQAREGGEGGGTGDAWLSAELDCEGVTGKELKLKKMVQRIAIAVAVVLLAAANGVTPRSSPG